MDAYVNQVTDYLLRQSWQIALLAIIVGLISFALKNKSAHIRYLLWLIVLAKCLVPPLYSVPVAVLPEITQVEHSLHAETPSIPIENTVVTETPEPVTIEKVPQPPNRQFAAPSIKQTIVLVWLAGMFLFLSWVGYRAVRYTLWLHRRSSPLPPVLERQFQELFAGFKFRKSPKIWLASDIAQPFVWGLFRGSVYLPADFTGLDKPQHHQTILVHELSHVARFDAAANLLQILAQAIFWFHPFVWWINKKMRQEREKCCDEMSVAHLSALPENYIDAIVEALAAERRSAYPVPSLAIVGSVRDIEERIKTMLSPGKKFYKRPSFKIAIVLILLAVLIVPISCTLTHRAKTEAAAEQEEKPSMSLVEAALAGDIEEVKRLIASGADVNATDPDFPDVKFTPVMAAANRGHAQVMQVLLENGAEVNATDFQGNTALYYAFWIYPDEDNEEKHRERAQLVKALIASGADVNKQSQGSSPLINAITTGTPTGTPRLGSIEAMLDAGADIHFKDNRGLTPLYWAAFAGNKDVLDLIVERGDYPDTIHLAACRGNLSRVRALLEEGTDVNARDEFGCTPLHWAARARSPEVAGLLIANGADVNVTAGPDNLTPLKAARKLSVIELLISAGTDVRSQENQTKLHDACSSGDIAVATFLLDKGADIHARNRRGATPLWVAAVWDQKEIVELLLERGANINALDRRRQCTPLWIAVRNGNKDTVELLIRKGTNIHTSDNQGRTPLDIAKQRGHTEIANILRQHGAKENPPSLIQAVNSGDIEQFKLLISQGADINGERGMSLLLLACQRGRKGMAEILISKGADVNTKRNNGRTPLHVAAIQGQENVAGLLVSKGADINARDNRGGTPLHLAVLRGYKDVAEMLIAKGAEVNAKGNDGRTPLHVAALRGHKDMSELLIAKGADVNAEDNAGVTPLGLAEENVHSEIAALLRKHGAKISVGMGNTPLHLAVRAGDTIKAKSLIAQGADVNAKDKNGVTPLDFAARRGNVEILEVLVANGADIEAKRDNNLTALHTAVIRGQKDFAEMLLDKSANIHAKENNGETPLHIAANRGHKDVAEMLIAKGAEVNAKENHGETPLHIAVNRGNKDIVELLITHKANVDAENDTGVTPLSIAEDNGNTEIAELLKKHGAKE